MSKAFSDPTIEERFQSFEHTDFALKMRSFIYSIGENLETHAIEESLKWNQPSYVCKHGTAIRIGEQGNRIGYFVSCQTSIIATLKEAYPDHDFDKTRGLLLDPEEPIPEVATALIRAAVRYKIK